MTRVWCMGYSPLRNWRPPLANDNAWRRHIGPKLAAIGLGWVNFHCEIPLVVNARSGGGSESCGRPARSSLSDVEMMWDRIRGQSFAGRFAALCSANRTERDHAKFWYFAKDCARLHRRTRLPGGMFYVVLTFSPLLRLPCRWRAIRSLHAGWQSFPLTTTCFSQGANLFEFSSRSALWCHHAVRFNVFTASIIFNILLYNYMRYIYFKDVSLCKLSKILPLLYFESSI